MSNHPKILHINTVASLSSAIGSIMHTIDDAAGSFGFKSAIVAGYGSDINSTYVMHPKTHYFANVLEARISGNDGYFAKGATEKMLKFAESYNPDIVHLHNLHGYYLNLPTLSEWLKHRNANVVMTLHDNWMLTGRCAFPPQPECNKWCTNDCDSCQFKSRYPGVWTSAKPRYKKGLFNAHIVVPSRTAQKAFLRSNISDLQHSVIYNGIDKLIFNPDGFAQKLSNYKVNLLAVAAKWVPLKNLIALIKLADAMPNDWHLTIIGKSRASYSNKISFIPYIDSKTEMAQYYRGADVTLSASLAESFGMTIAESLACGTPAVVNINTAPCELINGENGAIADFSNTDNIIKAIRSVIGIKAYTSFYSDIMVDRYYALYKSILEAKL
jgi:glycosyltransferase involved in cell wall biosynthesis